MASNVTVAVDKENRKSCMRSREKEQKLLMPWLYTYKITDVKNPDQAGLYQ